MECLIEKLIIYIKKVMNEEFDYCIDYVDSEDYFLNRGSLEFAKVLNHYLDESSIVIRNDYKHFAVEYNDNIYGAKGKIKEKELYRKLTPEELIMLEKGVQKDKLSFDNPTIYTALIWELSSCSGVYVRSLVKEINQDQCI